MIPAGFSELRRAFWQHSHVAENGTSTAHYLLLFYAVECGLKAVYLQRKKFNSIEKIRDEKLRASHDLARWVKELRLPARITGAIPTFRLERDGSSWSVDQAHQAWRYGVGLVIGNEKTLVSWLRQIHGWIREAV